MKLIFVLVSLILSSNVFGSVCPDLTGKFSYLRESRPPQQMELNISNSVNNGAITYLSLEPFLPFFDLKKVQPIIVEGPQVTIGLGFLATAKCESGRLIVDYQNERLQSHDQFEIWSTPEGLFGEMYDVMFNKKLLYARSAKRLN